MLGTEWCIVKLVKLENYILNYNHRLKFDPNDRMIVKMNKKSGDLQFNVGREPWQNPTVYHIHNRLNLSQVRGHEEKSAPSFASLRVGIFWI
jgi:hypothetical protein